VFPRHQTQEVISTDLTAVVIIQKISYTVQKTWEKEHMGLSFEVIITTKTRFTLSSSRL